MPLTKNYLSNCFIYYDDQSTDSIYFSEQSAYSIFLEINEDLFFDKDVYFTNCFWPDFDESELRLALEDYAHRQRRYGGQDKSFRVDI